MILVNAENVVLGRLASFAAKKALEGEEVVIVNAEKAVVTGTKEDAMKRLKRKMDLRAKGNPEKGPKHSRMPDRVLRRSVRGMLPFKRKRGREAFRRVQAFIGIPLQFREKEFVEMPHPKEDEVHRKVELGRVCSLLGARW